MQQRPVGGRYGRGHGVYRIYGADDYRPGVYALAAAHASARDGRHYCEVLPHSLVQASLGKLLTQYGVALAYGLQTVAGYRANTAHAKARTRERLAVHHVIRQAQRLADHAHLVLEQELHWLDQLELQILRQAAHVVVALYRAGLNNVRIYRALGQEADALQLAGLLLEHADKLRAYDLALRLRVGHAGQLVQETVHGVHIGQVRAQLVAEDLDDLLALALAHQAVVHVHALQLLAHRLDEQRCDDRRVHAARQGQQHLAAAYLRAQGLYLLRDELLRQLRRGDSLHFRPFVPFHTYNSLQYR